ncbi:aminoglycoside phosphotransferase family protein [Virgibacillus salexigens]|uniref:Aminoglycoside phosphotransferase domain-containing protein n=1 Tax=Virgibacillus kapii TaxID=1638645 RepID=A0ABQ2DNH9_9BACI|nr:aminoglycoside phosphotransferase family protein [Virgibacillus kapii]GGJ65036.1 hypothetical protein GCM10007111_28650 [Virgibacillus kapii]
MNRLTSMLKTYYNLELPTIQEQKGGWASLAYKVSIGTEAYFLKVYEKQRASTPKYTELINDYAPVLKWLEENTELNGHLPVPILTRNDSYTCEDDQAVYMVYNYIEGDTIGDTKLSQSQIIHLAKLLSKLHTFGEKEIPMNLYALKESYDLPFLSQLTKSLKEIEKLPTDIRELLWFYQDPLEQLLSEMKRLASSLKNAKLTMRLCHTDLHYWNLMQTSNQLILIDWEGLKLAPVEADLMFFVDKPYFKQFLDVYRQRHNQFKINESALQFYQLRRKLEDIWEFLEQLMIDRLEGRARQHTINILKKELSTLI